MPRVLVPCHLLSKCLSLTGKKMGTLLQGCKDVGHMPRDGYFLNDWIQNPKSLNISRECFGAGRFLRLPLHMFLISCVRHSMYSFNKHLLSTYYVLQPLLPCAGHTSVSRTDTRACPHGVHDPLCGRHVGEGGTRPT